MNELYENVKKKVVKVHLCVLGKTEKRRKTGFICLSESVNSETRVTVHNVQGCKWSQKKKKGNPRQDNEI